MNLKSLRFKISNCKIPHLKNLFRKKSQLAFYNSEKNYLIQNQKRYTPKHIAVFTAASILIFISMITAGYIKNIYCIKKDISQNLLRLHIIAEDNEAENQILKLCVKDRILKDFSADFSLCDSIDDCINTANNSITEIKKAAEDELCRLGHPSTVDVSVDTCDFPTKTYGDISLPAGKYTALRLKIGKAEGKNWWCVMYPPLCLTDKSAILSSTAVDKLKSTLTPEEYQMISKGDAPTVKLKFRIAEILGKYF